MFGCCPFYVWIFTLWLTTGKKSWNFLLMEDKLGEEVTEGGNTSN